MSKKRRIFPRFTRSTTVVRDTQHGGLWPNPTENLFARTILGESFGRPARPR